MTDKEYIKMRTGEFPAENRKSKGNIKFLICIVVIAIVIVCLIYLK